MIEMTLNENHMLNTLAQNGNIAYPAQLLPLLVGSLSFMRVLWLIYLERKERITETSSTSNVGVEASTNTPTTPPQNRRLGFSLNFDKIFLAWASPDTAVPTQFERTDSPYIARPWQHRYLVALLPWLSTFNFWKIADGEGRTPDMETSSPTDLQTGYKESGDENIRARNVPISLFPV